MSVDSLATILLVGNLRGGLAYVNCITSTIFGGISADIPAAFPCSGPFFRRWNKDHLPVREELRKIPRIPRGVFRKAVGCTDRVRDPASFRKHIHLRTVHGTAHVDVQKRRRWAFFRESASGQCPVRNGFRAFPGSERRRIQRIPYPLPVL